jgi:hypothetical protein
MPDLFWNLLSLAGLCLVLVIILGGSGVDIPEEARGEE